ncbi:hypothetical protein [Chryseobacterium sp. HMWF035]|uniref:hypothetical protein n=1 Tax=Chryseobacterium sp. HMWF035 TaxID=2056868 RepID=UPI000D56AED2|nr:hypothetical protein [Chryseobacterium sp. HMWF035]PVV54200.1 hypothetical protein DD829_17810 [Chryseobacterium sp. HMWF035]
MKLFTIKQILSSCQLLDEAGNIVAERLANFVFSTNERLKIKDQIYRIKYSGLFWDETKYFDEKGNVVVMIDRVNQRIFHYQNQYTEIYFYRSKGFNNRTVTLYRFQDDALMMTFTFKNSIFKKQGNIETNDDFNNPLLLTMFFHHNLRESED